MNFYQMRSVRLECLYKDILRELGGTLEIYGVGRGKYMTGYQFKTCEIPWQAAQAAYFTKCQAYIIPKCS